VPLTLLEPGEEPGEGLLAVVDKYSMKQLLQVLQRVAACSGVLQRVAVNCIALQCVATLK